MDSPEENMITDWLKENGNPEIEIQVLNEVVDKLVEERDTLLKHRDEFAIEFVEWCTYYRDKNRNIYGDTLHAKSKYDETYTTKELLEIFKKEKGL